jgi:diguanylate cyclase (GGDEF)-like protein
MRRISGRRVPRRRPPAPGATASGRVSLTLSVGIAALSPEVDTSHALLHAADRALYAAKDRGRDQAVVLEHPPAA